MNEFKGTNSDWKEAGNNDNGIFISGEDKQSAICHVYYNNNLVGIGEGKANARLIANAKRMYDVLNSIVRNAMQEDNETCLLLNDYKNAINVVNDIDNGDIK